MSDKNLVNLDPVTPEFCYRVCALDELQAAISEAFRRTVMIFARWRLQSTLMSRAWLALANLRAVAGWAHAGLCHASGCFVRLYNACFESSDINRVQGC